MVDNDIEGLDDVVNEGGRYGVTVGEEFEGAELGAGVEVINERRWRPGRKVCCSIEGCGVCSGELEDGRIGGDR